VGEAVLTRLDGPAPETAVARDMVKRAVLVAPVMIAVCGLIWGVGGALSTAYAIVLVLANFLLAAGLLAWTARISLGLMMGTALFGYLVRLGLIFLAVWLVKDTWWVTWVPLGLTIIVTHLGLLFWEMRYVSASLAFPGLKPAPVPPASAKES
jgi:hypothetical protein